VVRLSIFLLTSGALAATIQDIIDSGSVKVIVGLWTYQENVEACRSMELSGEGNPSLLPESTYISGLTITDPDIMITGFSLLGNNIANSIEISNCSAGGHYLLQ